MSTEPRTAEEHLNRIGRALEVLSAYNASAPSLPVALESLTALRAALAEMEREGDQDAAEFANLLEYARKAAGRRDVHSIHEVLDQVTMLRQKIEEMERKQGSPERQRAFGRVRKAIESYAHDHPSWEASVSVPVPLGDLRALVADAKTSPLSCAYCGGPQHPDRDCVTGHRYNAGSPSTDTEMLAWLADGCTLQQLEKIWTHSDPTLDGLREAIRVEMGSPAIPSPAPESGANRESDALRAEVLRVLEPFAAWVATWTLPPPDYAELFPQYATVTYGDARKLAVLYARLTAALPNPESHQEDALASNGLPKGTP